MGAVVVIVNLPDIKPNEIKLTGEVLADIYRRQDHEMERSQARRAQPRREAAEPGDRPGVSRRRLRHDLSCSPPISRRSARTWKSKVGANTSVNWPAGAGAKGNDGVAATVHNTRGGIGYVENAYATQNKLVTTQLRNKAGQFVDADHGGILRRGREWRLGECAELRREPDRPAGREELADRLRHLHRAAEGSEGRQPAVPR